MGKRKKKMNNSNICEIVRLLLGLFFFLYCYVRDQVSSENEKTTYGYVNNNEITERKREKTHSITRNNSIKKW